MEYKKKMTQVRNAQLYLTCNYFFRVIGFAIFFRLYLAKCLELYNFAVLFAKEHFQTMMSALPIGEHESEDEEIYSIMEFVGSVSVNAPLVVFSHS